MQQSAPTRFVAFRDFKDPASKLTPEWILENVRDLYSFGGAKSMLYGKDVDEINKLAAGNHDTDQFKDMFRGLRKEGRSEAEARLADEHHKAIREKVVNVKGIDFAPLGILQQPLASALAVLQKQQTYVGVKAIDGTAQKNRNKDLAKLRNRPYFEKDMKGVQDRLGVPMQAPETEYNTKSVDISTLSLDPSKPDELNLYADLFYKLRPESAMETALYGLMYQNDFKTKIDLERRDQVYYGCSAHRGYFSDITGLPQHDYLYPGDVYLPDSKLPDFADVPFKYVKERYDAESMLNKFGNERINEEVVIGVFNDFWQTCGGPTWESSSPQERKAGVEVVYMEFKSFDVVRLQHRTTREGRRDTSVVKFDYKLNANSKGNRQLENKYPQQTYYAYWVPGTAHLLKYGRVEGSFREKGKESIAPWTINVWKAKEKSDVELCRSIVYDAQRAYTKLQHAIIMAKPNGAYIDMRFIRNAAQSLKGFGITEMSLLTLFAQDNIMIGDTDDMDGAQDGNFKPHMPIAGGLGADVKNYLDVIRECHERIARITGINDALTGQAPNPDGLVGMQKLLLQSSVNSLYYAQKAIKHQTEKLMKTWAPMVQYICRPENKQTAPRRAMENIIGMQKVEVLADMDGLQSHQFGLVIEDAPNEDQQEQMRQELFDLVRADRLDYSDYYGIKRIFNVKDQQALLVIREKKKAEQRKKDQLEQLTLINQKEAIKESGKLNIAQVMAEGEVQEEMVKADKEKWLAQFDRETRMILQAMMGDIERMKKAMAGQTSIDKQNNMASIDSQRVN